MERARIGLRIATIASLVAIVYAVVVHAATNAVGLVMFMPDELNAYHMLVTLGFADAWHGYWEGLIGRVSAIGLLPAEL